jgi:hypothetical protein
MRPANKQLAKIDPAKVREKAKNGQALTLKEAAVLYGYTYDCFLNWKAELPLVGGKLFDADFIIWRRKKSGLESRPPAVTRPQAKVADRFCGFPSTHG